MLDIEIYGIERILLLLYYTEESFQKLPCQTTD